MTLERVIGFFIHPCPTCAMKLNKAFSPFNFDFRFFTL